ncbi:copper resistance protein CopC [Gluconobacter oxydans]|uniref:copper homeostasis periplasmic binding protein CopC n=1 Tax=Gluconobacter thailandicus TaxID=257438 RepID=UPI0002996E25|nr:copper homeostasis periplasmic binding protein CopC [Gluconobacter thailandicus]AFW01381.1 copper resistance protein CopC [Gluconobacter oxydans H24]ANQ40027.1 copper resistance protein CopC [Gluconobacter oxydans]
MSSFRGFVMTIAAAGALLASSAFAHTKLVSSTPAANATVAAPPQITLSFSEGLIPKLSGAEIVMTGMPGMSDERMTISGYQTSTAADGKTLVLTLAQPLSTGNYQVAWHAVSTDTHRVEGILAFTVK